MKINDLVEFKGSYFLILSNPFVLKSRNSYSALQVVKVVDLSSETIDLLEVENNKIEDKVDWGYISYNQTLSESFIREFQDKIDWHGISCYQTLSESFIREFQDKVNWYCISFDQTLSESFIREFQDKVGWDYISSNVSIPKEVKEKFRLEGKF